MRYLIDNNIMAQQHYIPIYKFSIYGRNSNGFSGSEKYFNNSISIPIFINLSDKDQNKIIKIVKNYLKG
jgi:dTDP-4-amino-4,6-dideoxygalactose transaminase